MANLFKSAPGWRTLLAALAAGILLSVFGMVAQAQAAGTPAVQQSEEGRGDDEFEVRGRVEAMPQNGLIGQWTISGKSYTTTAQTEFDQQEGAFAVGGCVKAQLGADRTTVRELDSEPAGDCNGGGGDDDNTGREFYGSVEAMPAGGFIGQWTISGSVYTVTAQTEIKQRFGPIEVGSCVEVSLTQNQSAVRELQSKRDAYCNRGGDDDSNPGLGKGELYGQIVSFPANLVGVWQIGAITMTADANTEFEQRNGAFAVGGYVKAEFRILSDGSFLAREIKTINNRDDDDDDDDRGPGRSGKAFGVIESVPAGSIGIWQISGISYTVTISTELDDDRGALIAGQTVKVEYWRDAAGKRTAREIKAMPERAGNPEGLLKLYGTVETLPADGFVGAWTVSGVELVADANSRFEEEHGLLAAGAFVEVKYVMQGSTRLIVKMETHVPPGGGDDDRIGRIDRMDDSLATAAANATWTIGGVSYVVTDATSVSSGLAVGSSALVNSYTAADGSQVATRIGSLALTRGLYLPAITR